MATWYTANFVKQGGTCSYTTLYYYHYSPSTVSSADGWYIAKSVTSANKVHSLGLPMKPGCSFLGGFASANGTGTCYVRSSGDLYGLVPSELPGSTTFNVYLCWSGPSSVTLSKTDLAGGAAAIFYDPQSQLLSADSSFSSILQATTISHGGQMVAAWGPIDIPSKECYKFYGFFSASNNSGTEYVTADGYVLLALVDVLAGLTANDSAAIYAKGVEVSKKLTLSANGGNAETGWLAIYNSLADRSKWYTDSLCAGDPISAVPIPGRIARNATTGVVTAAYVFQGYKYGSTVYIDPDGTLNANLTSITNFTARTASAQWLATRIVSVAANDGVGGDRAFFYCYSEGTFHREVDGVAAPSSSIVPPSRPGFVFAGCRVSDDDDSAFAVNADGTIASGFEPTGNTTVYARWTRVSWCVSFGGGELPDFYVKADVGGLYRDADCTEAVVEGDALAESAPTLAGHVFLGVFAAEGDVASTRYATAAGEVTAAFAALEATADMTVWCVFGVLYPITFDGDGGEGGQSAPLWYLNHKLFADNIATIEATWPIAVPSRECHRFDGYIDELGTSWYFDADGDPTASLAALMEEGMSEALALRAQWTRATWHVMLDDAGGEGGDGVVYSLAGGEQGWASDDVGYVSILSVSVPTRDGYAFLGYYTQGGSIVVNADGSVVTFAGGDGDVTLLALWQAREFTLSFSDGSTPKTVTWGLAVGTLPVPSAVPSSGEFAGWLVGNAELTADTRWRWPQDITAVARFARTDTRHLHETVDWFNLASDALVPISSDSGDGRQRVAVRHYGRAANGVNQASCVWRNPSVTYMVVRDLTLDVTLGRAFAAVKSGSTMTVSGYMITTVRIDTAVKAFPTITVSAVANEGVDAINLFRVMGIRILARARPQNLMNAVSVGAGELQSLSLAISCQPVVVAEKMAPCASDVVDGEINVEAETEVCGVSSDADKPAAGNGFAEVGVPQAGAGGAFRRWKVKVRKELE